ncbi:MAG: hypothetical protein K9G42_00370 [Pedobacter sp.]|nr:hypothetical protein [Pedobacter sp.]
MQNSYPVVAIIIAILLSLAYFFYIKSSVKSKVWDTATNFVATMLSIVIGAMISIIIYNSQQKNQDERKLSELRTNLEAELSDINRILVANEVMTVGQISFLITYIEPVIIQECAKSGLFQPKEVENLLHISRKIKFYNTQVNYILSILASSPNPSSELLAHSSRNLETTRVGVINGINLIKVRLNLKLSDSINFD